MINSTYEHIDAPPGETVLITSDALRLSKHLRKTLRDTFDVYTLRSNQYIIDVTHKVKPSVILLDILLPNTKGYTYIERLKSTPDISDIPVIFLTSKSDESTEEQCLSCGAVDYIAEPFNPRVVNARVKTHMDLYNYKKKIERLMITDTLTYIYNRRGFDEILAREWGRALRENLPISLLMIDVDSFKAYNDLYGHPQGDDVLQQIADAIRSVLDRVSDIPARYGGEEFAVILPNTGAVGAKHVAQKLIREVRSLNIVHRRSSAADHVTVSIGIATVFPQINGNANELTKLADEALYIAKKSGKNGCRHINECKETEYVSVSGMR